ncbi:hypothetical protein, partial [Lampropedia aestuarii]|uniref:hypothetical protein n=1 Tax=Lampropedia aestuarii TaxID=2562762 RepID=UPI0014560ABB
ALTVDSTTGDVIVAGGTPPGVHTLEYEVCEINDPSNCETKTVTVNVSAGQLPSTVTAPREVDFAIVDQRPPVITEITFDGTTPASWQDLTATVQTPAVPAQPGAPVPTVNPLTGEVLVPANTPAGTYTIELKVCERAIGEANCTTLIVPVVVDDSLSTSEVVSEPISASKGGQTDNMLTSGTKNGEPIVFDDMDFTITKPATPTRPGAAVPELDVSTGIVTVAPGTPAGTYSIEYQMCDRNDPDECATGVLTIIVVNEEIVPVPVDSPIGLLLSAMGLTFLASRVRRKRQS